ncbi:MAG: AAA family ATPase [Leadbetterella sp.]|nr:AAA family ATPase [Leadbetterella sp.]
MRIDKVYIEQFKNLNQFTIDLDETKMQTVLLGENAAGKSNFLEALVIIFRDLELGSTTSFNYEIIYRCKQKILKAVGGPSTKGGYNIYEGFKFKENKILFIGKPIAKNVFSKDKFEYLPRYVFAYYSGVSNRLIEHFDYHQKKFASDLLKGVDRPLRPLFYAQLIHSHFVLLAFYSFTKPEINKFLEDYLDIIGLESILFVFKKPSWKRNNDVWDFWGADGVVREFLDELFNASMAPITFSENVRIDFRRTQKEDHLYLYISNQEKLQKLAEKYEDNAEFFKRLESTYISELIKEVRVKVKKRHVNGDITFKELSEGEQQLLTVLGLLRFTKEEESLILLDEPDTHLNPLWKWKYMNLLQDIVRESKPENEETSQIIMTTHDPLVIGGLTKEEIRIFYTEKGKDENYKDIMRVKTMEPDFDPKGLGVAGILTSEFFKLPSTLDEDTLDVLKRRNELIVKQDDHKLTDDEASELKEIFYYLNNLGINTTDRDPLYEKFIVALSKLEKSEFVKSSPVELKKQNEIAFDILKRIINESEK